MSDLLIPWKRGRKKKKQPRNTRNKKNISFKVSLNNDCISSWFGVYIFIFLQEKYLSLIAAAFILFVSFQFERLFVCVMLLTGEVSQAVIGGKKNNKKRWLCESNSLVAETVRWERPCVSMLIRGLCCQEIRKHAIFLEELQIMCLS